MEETLTCDLCGEPGHYVTDAAGNITHAVCRNGHYGEVTKTSAPASTSMPTNEPPATMYREVGLPGRSPVRELTPEGAAYYFRLFEEGKR